MSAILWMVLAGYMANIYAIAVFAKYGQFGMNCMQVNALICFSVVVPFASFVMAFMLAKE